MSNAKNMDAIFMVLTESQITLNELEENKICSRHKIVQIMSKLVSYGYVERLENGIYRLSESGKSLKSTGKLKLFHSGARAAYNKNRTVKDSLRNRLWKLIRLQKKFTVNELLNIATNGDEKDPKGNTRKYLKTLIAAGYIQESFRRVKGEAKTSNGFKQYVLVKDNGNKAPVLRRNRNEVYDPNNGEVVRW